VEWKFSVRHYRSSELAVTSMLEVRFVQVVMWVVVVVQSGEDRA
jgi:hypothetical protein